MLALLLPVAAAEPADWAAEPVATDLHPVAWDHGARYQALLASAMGGPRANPVFGPVTAEADLHWRLLAATGEGLPMDTPTAATWRDLALAGTFFAAEGVLDETLSREPVLHAVYVFADAIANPSLEFRREGEYIAVRHPPGRTRNQLDRASAEAPPSRAERRRRPTFRAGVDWTLRDEDAAPQTDLVRWVAFVSLDQAILTRMRADFSLFDHTWNATARQRVYPQIYLTASARSRDPAPPSVVALQDTVPGLARISTGVMWTLPGEADWSLRLERVLTVDDDAVTWLVTLRGEAHSPIAAQLPSRFGLPAVPERGRNTVAAW